MAATVRVARLPACQFTKCGLVYHDARYDFRTKSGPWAYGCQEAWETNRASNELGNGKGQKLMLEGDT